MEPDDLYGLPFDRFVPERQALAKALRAERRRDEAAAVAALRKPSVAAWAVNQLVRTQGSAVDELYDAGDALRSAQADLLAGSGEARTLRAANERERAAVDALVDRARGLLTSEGQELSASVVERVADTLHAAALDEAAREQVRGGCLERELRFVGLGLGESPAPPPAKATPKTKGGADAAAGAEPAGGGRRPSDRAAQAGKGSTRHAPKAKRSKEEKVAERERLAAERAAERDRRAAEQAEEERLRREREEARKAARAAEAAARRHAERAARALRNAEERRDRAAQALDEAEEALAIAREEAREADAEHQRARAELEHHQG